MANGYILNKPINLQPVVQLDLAQTRCWLQALIERYMPPPCTARPLGLHLPDRVWRRHSAWLTCIAERNQGNL